MTPVASNGFYHGYEDINASERFIVSWIDPFSCFKGYDCNSFQNDADNKWNGVRCNKLSLGSLLHLKSIEALISVDFLELSPLYFVFKKYFAFYVRILLT